MILGFGGLFFILVDSTSNMGSKLPITMFFLFIMIIGIVFAIYHKRFIEPMFGEVPPSGIVKKSFN